MEPFQIDPDIRRASTLPSEFYSDPSIHVRLIERLFARSWQLLCDPIALDGVGAVLPLILLPGCLDEPLLLTRDEAGRLHCLSNVCTHRGNLVAARACTTRVLRCAYHGRRFALDGRFLSMPEFDEAEGFPTAADDLPRLVLEAWGPLTFAGMASPFGFDEWIAPVRARLDWLVPRALRFDPESSRDYVVAANWMLYCDNYLEGFHIPYVHPGLAGVLDYGAYTTETFSHASLQVGIAADAAPAFEFPAGHPDRERRVAAYYFWLFPNLMLNFYPWGLSVNLVVPEGPARTRVRFLSYLLDPTRRAGSAGADLDGVELEDEAVVESVQRGVRSRLYRRGRYSPSHERCVHHFHRLVASALEG